MIIPCYNEAPTIAKVVDDFRRELPEAEVYVYDNNSTDGTAKIARAHGGASGDRRTAGIGLPDARLYGKCSEVHGSVRRQAPRGGQVCGGPGEGRAGPQDVTVVIEKASPATLAAAAKKSAAAGIADSRRDDPAKTIR